MSLADLRHMNRALAERLHTNSLRWISKARGPKQATLNPKPQTLNRGCPALQEKELDDVKADHVAEVASLETDLWEMHTAAWLFKSFTSSSC